MKLYYFAAPGSGETTRIMLHYGGLAFEDIRLGSDEWAELKQKMPYGQVPVLELDDGSMLAQSSAIEHYVSRRVKLLPEDSLASARCYEICGLLEDCNQPLIAAWAIQDPQERRFKLKTIAETTLTENIKLLEQSLAYYDTQRDDMRKAFKPDFFDVPTLKLYYFVTPGRAEPSRIMLNYGGIPFEDVRISRDQWPELKPKMPFGQVPVLQLADGCMLAQSHTIDRYVARLVGLSPSDSLEVARCDEVVDLVDDIWQPYASTFMIQDVQERIAKRKGIAEGHTPETLGFLAAKLGGNDYFVGNKLSFADIVVFTTLSMMCSGWMDGLDSSLVADFPVLKAHHKRVASVPAIMAFYGKEHDSARKGMKPDFFG